MERLRVLPIFEDYPNPTDFVGAVKKAVIHSHGEPLLIVFKDTTLGIDPISRDKIKDAVREISAMLPSETHVFFGAMEKFGKGKFSNTGYIVSPRKEGKPSWKAYSKLWVKGSKSGKIFLTGDEWHAIESISGEGIEARAKNVLARAKRWIRGRESKHMGHMQEITVRGKKVRFMLCNDFDSVDARKRKADLLVVSSGGIEVKALDRRLGIIPARTSVVFANTSSGSPMIVRKEQGKRKKRKTRSWKIRRV